MGNCCTSNTGHDSLPQPSNEPEPISFSAEPPEPISISNKPSTPAPISSSNEPNAPISSSSQPPKPIYTSSEPASSSLNWSDENGILWEIEQQQRHLCWIHVVTNVLEAKHTIMHKKQIKLSKQELLDKIFQLGGWFDKGTYTYPAKIGYVFGWIITNGLSIEADYGSGKYEGTMGSRKDKKPNGRVLHLSNVTYYQIHEEVSIMNSLSRGPGAAILNIVEDEMAKVRRDPTVVYTVPKSGSKTDAESIYLSVVVSGYDNRCGKKAYWVRDSLVSRAPNNGHYRASRDIEDNVFISPVAFPGDVWVD